MLDTLLKTWELYFGTEHKMRDMHGLIIMSTFQVAALLWNICYLLSRDGQTCLSQIILCDIMHGQTQLSQLLTVLKSIFIFSHSESTLQSYII